MAAEVSVQERPLWWALVSALSCFLLSVSSPGGLAQFSGISPQVAFLPYLAATQKVFMWDFRDITNGSLSLGTLGEQPPDSLHQYLQDLPASGLQVSHGLCHH